MATYIQFLIRKYFSKGIIIDTNLLILYLIGSWSPDYIGKSRVTYDRGYTVEDFRIINRLLQFFKKIIITPQILAELSNLTFDREASQFKGYFAEVIGFVNKCNEKYISKDDMISKPFLSKIGFTDQSIIEASKNNNLLVLTDDFPLVGFLTSSKCDFINLNHIRAESWLK
ncbi:MAG: hypothetical protein ACKKMV_03490 [Candidatus Nealsonbacteria bacterium]